MSTARRQMVWAFGGPIADGQESHVILREQIGTTQEAFCGASPPDLMRWNTAAAERRAEREGGVHGRTKTPPRCRKCMSAFGRKIALKRNR